MDAMATLEGTTERARATPAAYASCLSVVNSARDMATVAVKVTAVSQSEHAAHAPQSGPVYLSSGLRVQD